MPYIASLVTIITYVSILKLKNFPRKGLIIWAIFWLITIMMDVYVEMSKTWWHNDAYLMLFMIFTVVPSFIVWLTWILVTPKKDLITWKVISYQEYSTTRKVFYWLWILWTVAIWRFFLSIIRSSVSISRT